MPGLPVSPGCHAHIDCTIACPGIALQLLRSHVGLMLVGGRLDRCLFNLVVRELWTNSRITITVCVPSGAAAPVGPVPAVGEVKNITNGNEMQEKNMIGGNYSFGRCLAETFSKDLWTFLLQHIIPTGTIDAP